MLSTGCSSEPQSPNVVLISVDTLRADRMSLYGYQRSTTPNLEHLALDGVVFDSFFYNGGGTLPSHITMMTSLTPVTHGITPHNGRSLGAAPLTLAEHLGSHGYSTAGFVDGGYMAATFGFAQGFDLYDDRGGRLETIQPKVTDWLHEHRDERFFLFLHTYDVHSESKRLPYECPGEQHLRYVDQQEAEFDGCREGRCASKLLAWTNLMTKSGERELADIFSERDVQFISDLYDGCINYVDERLGDLVATLESLSVYDQTVIIVTSDHGEEFLEHGMFIHDQGGYDEYAHLPLLIKFPGSAHAGTRVPHLAAMIDLMPTVLDILGLPIPASLQGASLLPTLAGKPVRHSVHMYDVLRRGTWKYFSSWRQLYDLSKDPTEQHNLYSSRGDVVDRLERQVREIIAADQQTGELLRRATDPEGDKIDLSEEEREQLEALGYLQ